MLGVAISQIAGDNSILSKAKTAKEKYQNALNDEQAMLNSIYNIANIDNLANVDSTRDAELISTDIGDFTPVVDKVSGREIQISIPQIEITEGNRIFGYIYLLNNQVVAMQTGTSYIYRNLTENTSYEIKVIAIDKYGKMKVSRIKTQSTANATYLYKNGEKLIDLYPRIGDNSTITENATYLSASCSDSRNNWTYVPGFRTDNIDLTGINKVYIHFYDVNMSSEDVTVFISAIKNYESSLNYPTDCYAIDKKANEIITNGEFTLELDTSSLSGNHYLYFGGFTTKDYDGVNFNNGYYGDISWKVDAIWY